ncbi:MAG TPA: (2Fe-2S)-binding protein [Chloroflexota bacterium]|nr:(2Fe-2S)-binding protein [Chloroflexota bacterium]
MELSLTINGDEVTWDVPAYETLLNALRRYGYTGAKRVCESGECGACAVVVDGLAVDSCIMLAAQADGSNITTVEGLEGAGRLHPVQDAFAANGSIQCGFCIPGMIVAAANYLETHPQPTETEIRHMLIGNLCRCTGYKKPVEAILAAARGTDR